MFRYLPLLLLTLLACSPPTPELFEADLSKLGPLRQERIAQAEQTLLDTLAEKDLTPKERGDAYGALAKRFHAYALNEAAIHYYALATDADSANFIWPYLHGRALRGLGRIKDAVPYFEQSRALEPYPPTLLELANEARQAGELDTAERDYNAVLAVNPESAAALIGLAQIALDREAFATARELAERAIALQDGVYELYYVAGLAARGQGELDVAKDYFAKEESANEPLRLIDPLMLQVRMLAQEGRQFHQAGQEALARKDYEAAREQFAKAVDAQPSQVDYRIDLALTQLRTGQKDQALENYLRIITDRPRILEARYNAGGLLLERKRFSEAAEQFQAIFDTEPKNADARRRLADARRLAGESEAALKLYQAMIADQADNPEPRLGRALMLMRLQRYSEADQALADDLKTFAGQPVFRQLRARILAAAPDDALRNGQSAMALLEPVLRQGFDVDLAEAAAMACAEVGRFDLATGWLNRAIEAARRTGRDPQPLTNQLRAYQNKQPSRTPLTADHPIFALPTYGR